MDTTTPALASIGIDIGKEVFHIVGFSTDGRIAFRRKVKRLALVESFKKLPPSVVVGMEACLSAHFVSRALRQFDHVCLRARAAVQPGGADDLAVGDQRIAAA